MHNKLSILFCNFDQTGVFSYAMYGLPSGCPIFGHPGDSSLMTFLQILILFIAAILGGTLNSVAGGGSFITLPALIFTGVLPINANATSTVALWPGSVASTWAYRKEFANQRRLVTILLSITSLIRCILGAELLVRTSQT